MDKYGCGEDEAVGYVVKNEGDAVDIMETLILNIADKTDDGILSLDVFRENGIQLTKDIDKAINSLIDKGILKMRDCEGFALERTGNTRSRYGEQTS